MPIKYIGRTTDFKGKTLWEILGNLKNFGAGRIVVRSRLEKYPEPSYFKILKVQPLANEEVRKVEVLVEKVFRGKKFPYPVKIRSVSYKADYRLLHKDEEADYCKLPSSAGGSVRLLPASAPFPPLLRELLVREAAARGEAAVEPKLKMLYRDNPLPLFRVAEDGETPTETITTRPSAEFAQRGLK
ncbi:small ribosomal subunit protein mS34 [Bacillus rossius redtenbacheri]|uniref:small ribosomal subunit protein mS34 n=1 Tax=Bacillus rossius redtenbacheri TaxID=93214 RepID=UPI002FDC9B6B